MMEQPASVPDRIIHATLQLINEHGLGGITMTSVAKGAGIARQTLYNHYADVDTIVASAISRHNTEAIELLEGALAVIDSATAKIEQLVRHVASVSGHHNQLLASPTLSRDARETLSDYDSALDGILREILESGRESGEFRANLMPTMDAVIVRHLLEGVSDLVAAERDAAAAIVAASTTTIMAAVQQT
ncbi:MAG: TetR/AcrR family transcriptional regulator [bacterium]|nr:TetR/AcrR family transcriptional regulator [bacterium]